MNKTVQSNAVFRTSLQQTILDRFRTEKNEVSGTSEFLPLEPPVRDTGAGRSSLVRNRTKSMRLHIFEAIELGDSLK